VSAGSAIDFSFDDLERELRTYLADAAGEGDVTAAVRDIQAAQAQLDAAAADQPPPTGEVLAPRVSNTEQLVQARGVQSKLLPAAPPAIPGFDVAGFNRFCSDVGGDYYDFVPLPDGRTAVVIADVSGKGVPAAMVMVMFRSILRLVVARGEGPKATLVHTSRLLAPDLLRGMFITVLMAAVDPDSREMTLVNAGHHPPLLWRPRLTGTRLVNVRGPALGVLKAREFGARLIEKTLEAEKGDCLCLYTDGALEAKNVLGEELGMKGLARVFRDHAGRPAAAIIEGMVSAIEAHAEEAAPHDDITLVVLRAL